MIFAATAPAARSALAAPPFVPAGARPRKRRAMSASSRTSGAALAAIAWASSTGATLSSSRNPSTRSADRRRRRGLRLLEPEKVLDLGEVRPPLAGVGVLDALARRERRRARLLDVGRVHPGEERRERRLAAHAGERLLDRAALVTLGLGEAGAQGGEGGVAERAHRARGRVPDALVAGGE